MKLTIKKKFFDMIKSGQKELEWRDAHITFVCEETKEKLRMEIEGADIIEKGEYEHWDIQGISKKEYNEMFTDKFIIRFKLKKPSER